MTTTDTTKTVTTKTTARKLTRRPIALVGLAAVAIGTLAATSIGIAEAATGSAPGQMVVIDATADPAGASTALKLYGGASNATFTPSAAPVYSSTGWSPVYDATGQPAPTVSGGTTAVSETILISHDHDTSWSVGGSLEVSAGFDLLESVDAELSAKITANHTWTASDGDGQSIKITALPGKTVWLEENVSTATITGTFTFDVNGTRYEVENVTITQPASPATGTKAAAAYRVMEQPSGAIGLPANTAGGLKPISSLPKLQDYIANGH